METIGSRLRYVRSLMGLKQWEIADACGVSKQAVTAWEMDRNEMTVKNVIAFWRKTGCDLHWVLTGEGIRAELASFSGEDLSSVWGPNPTGRFIPMLYDVEIARLGKETLDEILKDRDEKVVLHRTQFPCGPKSFWHEITGIDNVPDYNIQDRVCIDPDETPAPGDMVLVLDGTTGRLYFGMFMPKSVNYTAGNPFDLHFLNPKYPVLRFEEMGGPQIRGVMTEASRPRRR